MKTYSVKSSEVDRKWLLIDAKGLVLGRLAAEVSKILRGKHKACYTPHVDCGDYVIIVNAEKVHLTGNKLKDKIFFWHTGHPGGIKERTAEDTLSGKYPERLIQRAVERMVARRRAALSSQQLSKLFIYAGEEHPHAAQKPEVLDLAARNKKNVKG
jgi:large subunit ribosomal protein L13